MSTEDASIKKLEEFANRTGREIHYAEKAYPNNFIGRVHYHQRRLYISNNTDNTCFLVCQYDPKVISEFEIFCGVFFPVSANDKITVRQSNFLDRLNFIGKNKRAKTGYSLFDSKTVISECSDQNRLKFFQNRKVQEKILEAFKMDLRMKASLNALKLDFIPDLEGKTHFGIYITDQWILESNKLEQLFDIADAIRNQIAMNN